VRDQLLAAAATELEVDREDLELAQSHVRVKGSPGRFRVIHESGGRRRDPRQCLGGGPYVAPR
jgi:hypothetical protein